MWLGQGQGGREWSVGPERDQEPDLAGLVGTLRPGLFLRMKWGKQGDMEGSE